MSNARSCQAEKLRITCFRPRIATGSTRRNFFTVSDSNWNRWEELASALLKHARQHEVVEIVPTPFGRNFVIEGVLPAPDGRVAESARRLVYCQKREKRLH